MDILENHGNLDFGIFGNSGKDFGIRDIRAVDLNKKAIREIGYAVLLLGNREFIF